MLPSAELSDLYRMHQRMMWFGSTRHSARTYGSHALAYLLATVEQGLLDSAAPRVQTGDQPARLLPGLATDVGDAWRRPSTADGAPLPRVHALFSHDFNLLYLRQV